MLALIYMVYRTDPDIFCKDLELSEGEKYASKACSIFENGRDYVIESAAESAT